MIILIVNYILISFLIALCLILIHTRSDNDHKINIMIPPGIILIIIMIIFMPQTYMV